MNFYEDVSAKVIAGIVATLTLALLGWLYGSTRDFFKELMRLRRALLVLLDERRNDLWHRIDKSPSTVTPEGARAVYDLLARKDRIDRVRDAEWRAAGCPKEPLRRGME